MTQPFLIPTAPLWRRFFALAYETLFMGAISVLVTLFIGLIIGFVKLPAGIVSALWLILLTGTWWWYCASNWKKGQTLAMKVWQIRLVDLTGKPPAIKHLIMRFVWSNLLIVWLPLMAYAFLRARHTPSQTAFVASLFWWLLPWGFALLSPKRQFLYDFLADTQLSHAPPNPINQHNNRKKP